MELAFIKKNIKTITIILFFIVSGILWLSLLIYGHYYSSTDNAYINAHVVQIAPRITGKITELYVSNNQSIEKGAPLFAIDSEPFELAVNSAYAELILRMADLDNARNTKERVLSLVKKKFLSSQEGDNAIAYYKTSSAKVEQAKASLAQSKLNLKYTQVIAPVSGKIANLTLRSGDIVSLNQPLFVIISNEEFWVDANFKETEMAAIKPGLKATIFSDMYPKHPFLGIVESISGGTGSVFSLLPPQNATGNWVKVTQRVPVRVRILNNDPNFPLRIGTSAKVTIHLS